MPSPELPSPELPGPESPEDTKVCPYCAEVIRAAAIKCRYCQSDLTGTEQTAVPAAAPVPSSEVEAAGVPESGRPPRRDVLRQPWVRIAISVAVVLVLFFLALAFRDWRSAQDLEAGESAARTVRASVADKVEALLSYDHATFDEDLEAAKEGMTSRFEEEYEPTVEEIRDRALAQKRSQVAEVVAVAVVSESADEVETLVFVNTIASRAGTEAQRLMQNRVSVTLVEQDGTWLIDELSVPQA